MQDFKYKIEIQKFNKRLVYIDKFSFEKKKINFLLGESGIGKTLLSKAIFGLLDTQQLSVTVNNLDYSQYLVDQNTIEIQKSGFFVFQEPSSHFNPLLKIGTQLKEGSLGTGKNEKDILQKLWTHTTDDQLLSLLKVYPKPYRPSGGEKQRFLLAMAFKKINKFVNSNSSAVPLFIFDEPSGSLDDDLRNVFLKELFLQYRHKPFTILFITHDYSIISEVVKKHSDLHNEIVFKELSKKKTSISLSKFDEKQYLKWLNSKIENKEKSIDRRGTLLLSLSNKISVFNKTLNIYKDSTFKQPSSLQIHKNEIVYLKAPSGAGKTTIAKIMMGLIPATSFNFKINNSYFNQDTPAQKWKNELWGKQISMTFQHADEALNLKSTVQQTLLNLPRQKRPKSNELLTKLKLIFDSGLDESFLKKRIWQLSGGQKQRLNLLRAFLLETPVLILDEPLNGLDFNSIKKVLDLLIKRKEQGAGILIISHNEEIFSTIVEKASIYYLTEA